MNQIQDQIIITDTSKFENIIKTLKESLLRIDNNLKAEKEMMKKIDKTDIWSGVVQEKIYSKYIELSSCYNTVVESLGTYIKFLDNTIFNYKDAENILNRSIDKNMDNLNVN